MDDLNANNCQCEFVVTTYLAQKRVDMKYESSTSSDSDSETVLTGNYRKIPEKAPCVYQNLVVPGSFKSFYWKFFGFPATEDGQVVSKKKIVCTLCNKWLAYHRSTTNLKVHLEAKHRKDFLHLRASNTPQRPVLSQKPNGKGAQKLNNSLDSDHIENIEMKNDTTTLNIDSSEADETHSNQLKRVKTGEETNSTPGSSQNMAHLMSETDETQGTTIHSQKVSNAIATFLTMHLQRPEIVESQGFRRFVRSLGYPDEIPSKSELECEIIPKLYDSFRKRVAYRLSCVVGEVALAMEEWKSHSEATFVTISIYYQNPEGTTLENKVLNTLRAPLNWDESQWATIVDSVLNQWNLKIEKITAVIVSSSMTELYSALSSRGLIAVPCLLHTLQTCARTCFEIPEVASVISQCRDIIGAIAASSLVFGALALREQMLEMKKNPLLLDYPAVWTSTYNMLKEMLKRRNLLDSIFDGMENRDREYYEVTADQWKILEDLVNVLEPFEATIKILGGEKIPFISMLKPFLWQLVSSHLKITDTDSDMADELKELLSEILSNRYMDANVTDFLLISTMLDPRFKKLRFLSKEVRSQVSASVIEMLTTSTSEDVVDKRLENRTRPLNDILGFFGSKVFSDSFCSMESDGLAEEEADLELTLYQSEVTAPLDDCPLKWWARAEITANCPNMGKLAKRFHCVPAWFAPSTRLSVEAQILYDSKRANMPANMVDTLLFLEGNYDA